MYRVYLLHKKTSHENRIIAAAPTVLPLFLTVEVLGGYSTFVFVTTGLWRATLETDPTDTYEIYAVPWRNSVDDVRIPRQQHGTTVEEYQPWLSTP